MHNYRSITSWTADEKKYWLRNLGEYVKTYNYEKQMVVNGMHDQHAN